MTQAERRSFTDILYQRLHLEAVVSAARPLSFEFKATPVGIAVKPGVRRLPRRMAANEEQGSEGL